VALQAEDALGVAVRLLLLCHEDRLVQSCVLWIVLAYVREHAARKRVVYPFQTATCQQRLTTPLHWLIRLQQCRLRLEDIVRSVWQHQRPGDIGRYSVSLSGSNDHQPNAVGLFTSL
jgi:hypothetical protein